jgi:hypothetical protein
MSADVPDAPDTSSEALQMLAADGYTESFSVKDGRVGCGHCGEAHQATSAIVERTYRFEGVSNPDDEEIVFGLHCPMCGARGTLVSAYGPTADPEVLDVLKIIDRGPR